MEENKWGETVLNRRCNRKRQKVESVLPRCTWHLRAARLYGLCARGVQGLQNS